MAGFSSVITRAPAARPVTRPTAPQRATPIRTPNTWTSTPGPYQPGFVQATPKTRQAAQTNNPFTGPAAPPAGSPPLTTTVTKTVTPPPPDLSGSKYLGYLSPDQLNALNTAGYNYNQNSGDENAAIGNAQDNYNVQTANAQYEHDVNQEQVNEALAARGLFSSSIRANDLTDVNRTLADKQAAAAATLNTLVGEAQRAIINLNNTWGSTQLMYQGIAGANAAQLPQFQPHQETSQVPITPPTGGTPPSTSPPASHQPTIMQQIAAGHPNWFPPYNNARPGNSGRPNTPPKPHGSSGSFSSSRPQRVR